MLDDNKHVKYNIHLQEHTLTRSHNFFRKMSMKEECAKVRFA